jgi:arylsulfatase A-like enzyme
MNILFIHTHDTGRYIEPYGYNIPTPNLMEFAWESLVFRNTHCACPTCSPSRAALLSGMSPHSCGMLGLAHLGFEMNDYSKHMANFFKTAGMETVLCGVQHELHDGTKIGYDKVLQKTPRSKNFQYDVDNSKLAADYIKNTKKPFFMWFGMFANHRKYIALENELTQRKVDPKYVALPHVIFDTGESRTDMAEYITTAEVSDNCAGEVLRAVKEAGIEDETIIIYTTDHGLPMPRMKCNLFDTGTGVSFIMKIPEGKRNGDVSDYLISQIDVFPTLCDLLNIEKPDWLEGKSFINVINEEPRDWDNEIFSEVNFHATYEPMRSIRTKRYKLIKKFDDYKKVMPSNIDDSPSKSLILENGYLETEVYDEMLFDLYLDPVERVNEINNPRYEAVYKSLSQKLKDNMVRTKDPLLEGQILLPKGAKTLQQCAISPNELIQK